MPRYATVLDACLLVPVALADTLRREWADALLFRTLATLRTDIPLFGDVEQLRWNGPKPGFDDIAAGLDSAVTIRKSPPGNRASRKTANGS